MILKLVGNVISILCLSFILISSPGENMIPGNMVLVKGGPFLMGSSEIPCDEEPVHNVTLTNFYMGKYEVPQAEWQAVMGNNPSLFKGDNLPVESVTWYEAVEFCNKKSLAQGLTPCYKGKGEHIVCNFDANGYRLPTEAEWEYAGKGGQQSRRHKYSGSNDPGEIAWYEMNSEFKTRPPGQKKPNELEIYDMNGNIGEWCCDRYDKQYYENSPSANPGGPTTGSTRSYRGGGFSDPRELLRPAVRFNHAPGYKNYDLGVRLVKNDSNAGPPPPGMVLVQGGTFKMGSTEGKYGEKIVHPVTLTDFYIGKFEITQEEWKATMGNYPAERIGVKTPISFVDWYGAVEYCNKRSRMEGLTPCYTGSQDRITCNFDAEGYRLPTEAEWEYAARGGIKSRHFKYSGSNDINEVGLCSDNLSLYFEPVGKRKANELEIYDMSGNMWEWCWDWYDFDYYKTGAGENPRGPMTGIRRVIRGGSWFVTKECQWSTFRFYEAPHRKNTRIGFRVVRSVTGENENSYQEAVRE